MRYGVLSDVHGNVRALDALLAVLDRASVDRLICPGDLVGYGPRPNECVARIATLDAVAVAGNHDLMAIGRLSADGLGPLPILSTAWTRSALSDESRSYLAALPLVAEAADGVVVAHGSLDDPAEYVLDCAAGRRQLASLRDTWPRARGLLLGHTHQPMACPVGDVAAGEVELPAGGPWLLNPGAVGQAREPRPLARGIVLDLGRGVARFVATEYDVGAVRRELREAGLPAHACHLRPGRLARLRRRMAMRVAARRP